MDTYSADSNTSGCSVKQTIETSDQAVTVLIDRIKTDKLYDDWTTIECLFFMVEHEDDDAFDIAIREKHEGNCPGDPQVAPVVDRFRIQRDGTILWHNFLKDTYEAYEQVKLMRHKS